MALNSDSNEYEINLIRLISTVWSKRLLVTKSTVVFLLMGLVISLTSPDEYETETILISESNNEGSGVKGLSGLASLAGVDLGNVATNAIDPRLFSNVVESTPFLMQLMNEEYFFRRVGKKISLYEYHHEHRRTALVTKIFGLPFRVIGLFTSNSEEAIPNFPIENQLLYISQKEQSVISNLSQRILVDVEWDLNLVTITVEMQDPLVAARVSEFTRNYLTEYMINYSISKSKEHLDFINGQYFEKKEEFEKVQFELAQFMDQNKNVITAKARAQEEILQSKYNLAFSIYKTLAEQREQAKIKVNDVMPVFTLLEPVKIPHTKSKPKRKQIVFVSGILGLIIGSLIALISYYNESRRNEE
ncbi:MAG: Wzz/FepE/Etk N-terminal domain-containing protein [Cyclobacteriaceae bacterium]